MRPHFQIPSLHLLQAELDFFDDVTDVSGQLYKVPKDQRKGAAVDILRKLEARPLQKNMPLEPCYVGVVNGSAANIQVATHNTPSIT